MLSPRARWVVVLSFSFQAAASAACDPPEEPAGPGARDQREQAKAQARGGSGGHREGPARGPGAAAHGAGRLAGRRAAAAPVQGREGGHSLRPAQCPDCDVPRYIPPLHVDADTGEFHGGLFWDGRSSTLEDQASHPLLNPLEMNNADRASVVLNLMPPPLNPQGAD
jgi:hypothetical protein